jgi:uncharacterized protein (DUF1330 family)
MMPAITTHELTPPARQQRNVNFQAVCGPARVGPQLPELLRNQPSRGFAMPAYWVARSKINDPVAYKKYTDRVPGIIAKFGGKVLARGGRFQILEGPEKFHRFVVIEFPSLEQAVACHESAEYVEASEFRKVGGAGEVELVIVEGGDATVI